MGHVALYREWRPRRFAEVIGQEHVVRTLANAISGNRLAHAYLFCGPRGTGKTSVARLVARAVNCGFRDGVEPCNECNRCLSILDGSHLDIVEIDAASNRGIDEIRDLRERVRYSPTDAAHKVYIIDEVHMLTSEAFNALLKTLEEPPAQVLFIMATTEPHKLPLTILSRCQRFDFHRLTEDQIASRVEQAAEAAGSSLEPGAVRLIARVADGSLRDALSVLDQAIVYTGGAVSEDAVARIAGAVTLPGLLSISRTVSTGDVAGGLDAVSRLIEGGADPAQLLRALVTHWRDILVTGIGSRDLSFTAEDASELLAVYQEQGLSGTLRFLDILSAAEGQIRFSSSPRILLEIAVTKAAGSVRLDPATAQNGREGELQSPQASVPTAAKPERPAMIADPTLDEVMQSWEKVKEAASERQKPLLVRLESARPISVGDGKLRLADQRNREWEGPNVQAIEEAIVQVLGVRLKVEVTGERTAQARSRKRTGPQADVGESRPDPEPQVRTEAAAVPLPEPPPELAADDQRPAQQLVAGKMPWLEQAQDILGGTIISGDTRKGG